MKLRYLALGTISSLIISALIVTSQYSDLLTKTNDAMLTAQVKSAFFLHPITKSPNIHVETNQSIVSLKGEVQSPEEMKVAEFLSETIPGVVSVNMQQLIVKNPNKNEIKRFNS